MPDILPIPAIIPAAKLFAKLQAKRRSGQHKGHFGHGLIIGGCAATPGAAILAAQGALRAGIGKLSVLMDAGYQNALLSRQPEVMLADSYDIKSYKITNYDTVLLGPGLGQRAFAKQSFRSLITYYKSVKILDADGLNLLSEDQDRKDKNYDLTQTIITPHPGEAARLLGTHIQTVQADRVKATQALLAEYQCAVVVLKGANTLIEGAGTEHIYQCDLGSSAMSTAGMGDLLAGIILGLVGQGFTPIEAAQLAVYWHAFAADQAVKEQGTISVLASDLLAYMRYVY